MTTGLVEQIDSFGSLLQSLPEDPNNTKVRGDAFEQLCQWFLRIDPEYSRVLKTVWLWDEWPGRWGPEIGIDLVAETDDGKLWAIQAKGYDPESQVPIKEIGMFISGSGRSEFDYRLLISSASISKNAEKLLDAQEKPSGYLLYPELEARPIDWRAYNEPSIKPLKEPRPVWPHQETAINDVLAGFENHDRGQLIMACGTGKTLAGLWIDERMQNSSTLVFVPSLSLISQVSREWHANSSEPFHTLYVCSDKTVTDKTYDTFVSTEGRLGARVRTDPEEIRKFLGRDGKKVVFSTYQSSEEIIKAQQGHNYRFDLVICDEAHHCAVASRKQSPFTAVLDEQQILADKRLFMTATPRTTAKWIRDKANQRDIQTSSMDDETQFGPRFHTLTFGEAIIGDLLNDYRVVVMGVTESETRQLVEDRRLVELEDTDFVEDAESLACMLAMTKVIKKYDLQRILGFHNAIRRSAEFTSAFERLNSNLDNENKLPDMWTDHVSGQMPTGERNRLLQKFKSGMAQVNLLNNVRCLGEGVDVRDIDGVVFLDPKKSMVDITQAVGRAIRRTDPPKTGTIVIPVLIDDTSGLSDDEQLNDSRFDKVWQVLNALRDHDEILSEDLDKLRYQIGRHGRVIDEFPETLIIDIPTRVGNNFISSIQTRMIETSTPSWKSCLGMLQEYYDQEGDCSPPKTYKTPDDYPLGEWVTKQRSAYNKSNRPISTSLIHELEAMPCWTWSIYDADFDQTISEISQLIEDSQERGNLSRLNIVEKNNQFMNWIRRQRSELDKGTLTSERQDKIRTVLGEEWAISPSDRRWLATYAIMEEYIAKYGTLKFSKTPYKGKNLEVWTSQQRQNYRGSRIKTPYPQWKIDKLEKYCHKGWSWNPRNDQHITAN